MKTTLINSHEAEAYEDLDAQRLYAFAGALATGQLAQSKGGWLKYTWAMLWSRLPGDRAVPGVRSVNVRVGGRKVRAMLNVIGALELDNPHESIDLDWSYAANDRPPVMPNSNDLEELGELPINLKVSGVTAHLHRYAANPHSHATSFFIEHASSDLALLERDAAIEERLRGSQAMSQMALQASGVVLDAMAIKLGYKPYAQFVPPVPAAAEATD